MTNFSEIKGAIDKQMEAFEAFKETNDQRFNTLQERMEGIEAKGSNPTGITGVKANTIEAEHIKRFTDWVRRPNDVTMKSALGEIEDKIRVETKDLSVGSNADGGFAVPKEIVRMIERQELELSPVRRLVKVMQAGTSDFNHLVSIGGTTSGWSDETGNRTATDTSQLRNVKPDIGELYAYPTASNWSLEDMQFNVESWLAEEVAQSFAFQEGSAVINGDGANKPLGMLDTDPALTADDASPARAADVYQYVACDSDTLGSPAAPGLTADCLIELVYSLNSAYRSGASWIMNSTTAGAVRKLKDADGRYVWADSLAAGQPAMLLGYPVEFWEQMPAIAADAFPVGFGNFSRGYLLVDRSGLRITRDEITTPGLTKFYVRRREGGRPLNNNAIKFLRTIQ